MRPDIERRRVIARGLTMLAVVPMTPWLPAPAASQPLPTNQRLAGIEHSGVNMLVISGTLSFRKDRLEEAHRQARLIMTRSAAEAGCQTYELSAQITDPLTFRLFEEWESADALAAHFQTPHFQVFAAALPDLVSAAPKFLRYEVTEVSPLL